MTQSFLEMIQRYKNLFLIGKLREIIWTLFFKADYTDINRSAIVCDISQMSRQGSRGFKITSWYQSEILSGEYKTAK